MQFGTNLPRIKTHLASTYGETPTGPDHQAIIRSVPADRLFPRRCVFPEDHELMVNAVQADSPAQRRTWLASVRWLGAAYSLELVELIV